MSLAAALLAASLLGAGGAAREPSRGGAPDGGPRRDPDAEIIENLELLEQMDLLQNLELLEPKPGDGKAAEEKDPAKERKPPSPGR